MYHGQTLKAWREFEECEAAIDKLEQAIETDAWRARYAAATTLLHAIGHVLMHVDAKENLVLRAKLDALWQDIEKNRAFHKIYWNFIQPEREQSFKENLADIGIDESNPVILCLSPDGDFRPSHTRAHSLCCEAEPNFDSPLEFDDLDQLQEELFSWYELMCSLEFYIFPYTEGYTLSETGPISK